MSSSLVESLDAVCVIAQGKLRGQSIRRIREISEIIRISDDGRAETNTSFFWDPRSDNYVFQGQSYVFQKISTRQGVQLDQLYREYQLRSRLLAKLTQQNILEFKQVQDIISEYYKDSKTVLDRFGIR